MNRNVTLTAVDQYAVIGHPISHSKSPMIHQTFARQTSQMLDYCRIEAPLDGFESTIKDLIVQGYKGANVTVPFKLEAYRISDHLTMRASAAGAVNTLIFNEAGITGDNTDGAGLVRDIEQNLHIPIAGKRVLLVGAGGAADGVLQPILARKPAMLVVTNRTLEKALRMVQKVEAQGCDFANVRACCFDELDGQIFDIVINATSTGLSDTQLPLPASIFSPGCLAYDMMYGRETLFMALARNQGAQVADGLGMLVEQAAEAFFVWRGVRPKTQAVMQEMRKM